jgi:TetR/AcrR family transcriptional regulator
MPPRTKYKKSETSRQQVIDAAIATLAKKGFARTSVQDIADAANLSKGAVHYHFESKDDLTQCVLTHCCEVLSARARQAWEAPGPPVERIRNAIAEMWASRRDAGPEIRVISDLMAQGVHEGSLRKPLKAMFRSNREQILEALVNGLSTIGLRPVFAPPVIARLLVGTLDGLALHAVFDPADPADEGELLRALEKAAFALFELA